MLRPPSLIYRLGEVSDPYKKASLGEKLFRHADFQSTDYCGGLLFVST